MRWRTAASFEAPGEPLLLGFAFARLSAFSVGFKKRMDGTAGYAGLDNETFYMDKTMMVFGDAMKVVEDMVKAIE